MADGGLEAWEQVQGVGDYQQQAGEGEDREQAQDGPEEEPEQEAGLGAGCQEQEEAGDENKGGGNHLEDDYDYNDD